MSDVKFVGSIVAKLPIKKGMSLENFNYFKETFNVTPAGDEDYFDVDLTHLGLEVERTYSDEWVVRQVIIRGDEFDEGLKVTLMDVVCFKEKVEEYTGELNAEDITVQAYNWYTGSEEPIY